jgi:hypothetical protein
MASMRKAALAAFACAAFSFSGCAVQFEASGEYAESFQTDGASRAVFEGLDGALVLRGMDVTDAQIHGTRHAVGATRREARRRLGRVELVAHRPGADLEMAFAPSLGDLGLVDLSLDRVSTLPQAMGISADLDTGNIEISDLLGAVDVTTGEGDIEIEDPGTAAVSAATEEGAIDYALALTPFSIECEIGEEGAVTVDAALQSLIDQNLVTRTESDGAVTLIYLGTDADVAEKEVSLLAPDGEIFLSLLSRTPKTWQ